MLSFSSNTTTKSFRVLLKPLSAQPAFLIGIVLIHMKDLALGLVEPHETHMGPLLKPV